jgi:hypothetical protein
MRRSNCGGGRLDMHPRSRRLAAILLIVFPTVVFGGASILNMLLNDSGYRENELRQDLWRAGHAHAGVLLILSLVALRYIDEAILSAPVKELVRHAIPAAAILLPIAFFLSIVPEDAEDPNALIYLAYAGAAVLTAGFLVLGVGLFRTKQAA